MRQLHRKHQLYQLLVKMKPFRQEKRDSAYETESEEERADKPDAKHVELLGGGVVSEDDFSDVSTEDSKGVTSLKSNWRPTVAELEAVLQRVGERQRAGQPGRTKESDKQMLECTQAQGPLLDTWAKPPPSRSRNEISDVVPPGCVCRDSRAMHRAAVVKEHRDREGGLSTIQADTVDRVFGDTVLMNLDDQPIEECKRIPLPDLQQGPAHVA